MSEPRTDLVSVVVGVNPHDEPFGPILDAWAAQACAGDYEVVVVDSGSRPGVRDEYAAHRRRRAGTPVRLIDVDRPGRAAANNAGVRASRGALVLFVADDFRPARTLVAAHRRFHALGATPAVGVGGGYFAPDHRADAFRRWLEDSGMVYGAAFPLAGLDWRAGFFYVGNASMARSTFEAVGTFDERFHHDLFDDFEWSMRLRDRGIPTRFVPRAFAWHDHDVTLEYRKASIAKLGEAAKIYEASWQGGPRPWASFEGLDAAALEEASRATRVAEGAAATFAERVGAWQVELALAFQRGYRGG